MFGELEREDGKKDIPGFRSTYFMTREDLFQNIWQQESSSCNWRGRLG
jgi:hypothetical protein